MTELPKSYGVHLAVEIKTETRSFDTVDAAALKAEIKHEHLPEKPTKFQAISRALAALVRMCMSSIAFPAWSQHAEWETTHPVIRTVNGKQVQVGTTTAKHNGRNPNFSLKITQLKDQMKTDASTTWRINIANRSKAAENMGHVLSVTYDPTHAKLFFTQGTDANAYASFGKELVEIVSAEYNRFHMNYNDEDIRRVIAAELADMQALSIIKRANAFIPHTNLDRAKALYQFAKDCGQEVSWLGLDNSPETRDSLLTDLQASVNAAMDEYESVLDAKLNPKSLEHKRGEKRREAMYETAIGNIDKIFAIADYHAQVLGCMAEGLLERKGKLQDKAMQLLTYTGEELPVVQEVMTPEQAGMEVVLENAFE